MARSTSRGTCLFCSKPFNKSGMTRHLQACPARLAVNRAKENRGQARLLQLVVEGYYNPWYWMQIEVAASSTLDDLDYFLRETWLECCGHLSAFRIGGASYVSFDPIEMDPFGGLMAFSTIDEQSMWDIRLSKVLAIDSKFRHEYDFGTTTDLSLRVVSERKGKAGDGMPVVLARNDPPEIPCGLCDRPATRVCSMCSWEATGWLCDEHAGAHECGWEALLPVVNSPRTGQCAYSGPMIVAAPGAFV